MPTKTPGPDGFQEVHADFPRTRAALAAVDGLSLGWVRYKYDEDICRHRFPFLVKYEPTGRDVRVMCFVPEKDVDDAAAVDAEMARVVRIAIEDQDHSWGLFLGVWDARIVLRWDSESRD